MYLKKSYSTLLEHLDAQVEAYFAYLGLPLGLIKPKIDEFLPIVNRCERRRVSTSLFLSQVGRLQLKNYVFTALSTFYMSTFSLHVTIIEQIDVYRKNCLCRGSDESMQKLHGP